MNESRVVLDTSVVVSAALFPQSIPRQAVDSAVQWGRLLFSEATLSEVDEVLRRRKFERYVSEQRRVEFLLALIEQADIIVVSRRIQHCRDPKDDRFLELATEGHASHVVSGDADLLVLKSFEGVPILSPADFLALQQGRNAAN